MSRDELIHILSNAEKELSELRFQYRNCNCEYQCVRCSFPGCDAMALLHGKYDDVYANCTKIFKCKCNVNLCDQHILCTACKICSKCSKHEKCKYCDFEICPKNENLVIPPCDSCGLKRHFGCKDFDLCDCGESLCPECVQNCKTCGSLLCTYCNKNSECSKCDEN